MALLPYDVDPGARRGEAGLLKNTRLGAALCGGGAIAFSSLLSSLLGGTSAVRAQTLSGGVPEVDRVAVRVVVDSYQIAVAPSATAGSVEIRRFGWPLGDQPPSKAIISEFGLSMHVESRNRDVTRQVLFDFGYTAQALTNNAGILGVDPAALDALVLSHGHHDHFGGMLGFLDASKGRLRRNIPLYVGGEECFCARQWTAPPLAGDFGVLDRPAIERDAVKITIAEGPTVVADYAFTAGQAPQTTFEKLLSPSRIKRRQAGPRLLSRAAAYGRTPDGRNARPVPPRNCDRI